MKSVRRLASAALVALLAVTWSVTSAAATVPGVHWPTGGWHLTTVNDPHRYPVGSVHWSGSVETSTTSTAQGYVTWNVVSHTVTMTLVTGPLTAGYCVTTYFDWTSTGHHDSRALRSCESSDHITYVFKDATPQNIVNRPTKLGVCYGPYDKRGICVRGAGSLVPTMDWTPWPDKTRSIPCDLSWVRRNADGTTSSFIDPHSMLGGAVGDTRC